MFLLSVRSGAVGINLTQANNVFLLEPVGAVFLFVHFLILKYDRVALSVPFFNIWVWVLCVCLFVDSLFLNYGRVVVSIPFFRIMAWWFCLQYEYSLV